MTACIWSLKERHDAMIRSLLLRHKGREIETTGDGFLAAFDGPARAVACAQEAVHAVQPLEIEIRAGCHAGEVEFNGNGLRGIAFTSARGWPRRLEHPRSWYPRP